MLNPQLFERTVSVLVTAYLNGTLKSGRCGACAVGNLIAASLGYQVSETGMLWKLNGEYVHPEWPYLFATDSGSQLQVIDYHALLRYKNAAREIRATGYRVQQLIKIEHAFEIAVPTAATGYDKEIAGLLGVLDVLFEIHATPQAAQHPYKSLFLDAYAKQANGRCEIQNGRQCESVSNGYAQKELLPMAAGCSRREVTAGTISGRTA